MMPAITALSAVRKGALLYGPTSGMASRVRQEISLKLTEFAAEYYRQNP